MKDGGDMEGFWTLIVSGLQYSPNSRYIFACLTHRLLESVPSRHISHTSLPFWTLSQERVGRFRGLGHLAENVSYSG